MSERVSPYMDITECAAYLKIAVATLRKYTYLKKIPHRHHGRRVFFYLPEIDEWSAKSLVTEKPQTLSRFQQARERILSNRQAMQIKKGA